MNKYVQSQWGSLKETILNISSGFFLSLLVWIFIISPIFYHEWGAFNKSISITLIYTVISIIRSFCWRRYFNYRHKKKLEFYLGTTDNANFTSE